MSDDHFLPLSPEQLQRSTTSGSTTPEVGAVWQSPEPARLRYLQLLEERISTKPESPLPSFVNKPLFIDDKDAWLRVSSSTIDAKSFVDPTHLENVDGASTRASQRVFDVGLTSGQPVASLRPQEPPTAKTNCAFGGGFSL